MCPSTDPPGGLDPSVTPQFILFTASGRPRRIRRPAPHPHLPVPADCGLTQKLWDQGWEIADHTLNHYSVRPLCA